VTARVLLAISDRSVESSVIRVLADSNGAAALSRRCVDLIDALAAAAAGAGDVLVVSSSLRRLDRDAVEQLAACDVSVVVVREHPRQDGSSDELLPDPRLSWGVRAVVDPDPQQVLRAVVVSPVATSAPSAPAVASTPVGTLIAVWGPTGAPGRTTVAVTVADELARAGHDTVLVDADTYGASVAQVLGLLDDTSGLASLTRLAATGRLDEQTCARAMVMLPSGLRVLTGIARPDRWVELRAASLQAVLSAVVAHPAFVVLDCGFGLGAGAIGGWPTEIGPPERDDACLAALSMADIVLAVGSADPVGLVRLSRDLPTVPEIAPTAQLQVVVTKCRPGAVGGNPQRSVPTVLAPRLVELSERFGPRVSQEIVLVPDDRSALDTALLSGRTLAETSSGSPARRALRELVETLAPTPPVQSRRSRRLRRAG